MLCSMRWGIRRDIIEWNVGLKTIFTDKKVPGMPCFLKSIDGGVGNGPDASSWTVLRNS